jgi:hypothetical protein
VTECDTAFACSSCGEFHSDNESTVAALEDALAQIALVTEAPTTWTPEQVVTAVNERLAAQDAEIATLRVQVTALRTANETYAARENPSPGHSRITSDAARHPRNKSE